MALAARASRRRRYGCGLGVCPVHAILDDRHDLLHFEGSLIISAAAAPPAHQTLRLRLHHEDALA